MSGRHSHGARSDRQTRLPMSSHHPLVLVTGANRGIGAAVARLAAVRGYGVLANYRADREAAERVRRQGF